MGNTTMRAVIIRVTTLNSYAGAANRRLRASPPRMTKRQWYKRSSKGGPVVDAGGFVCANGEWGVIEAGGLRDTTVPRNRWMCNARRAWQTAAAHQQPARSKHLLV